MPLITYHVFCRVKVNVGRCSYRYHAPYDRRLGVSNYIDHAYDALRSDYNRLKQALRGTIDSSTAPRQAAWHDIYAFVDANPKTFTWRIEGKLTP